MNEYEKEKPDWIKSIEPIDEYNARVTVLRDDGKTVVYRVPRRPLIETNGSKTDHEEAATG